jgi:ethanolamine ammonia-lyase small subunit
MPDPKDSLAPQDWPEIVRRVRAKTPARVLVGRAGAAYRTTTQIELREAHAAARDAVRAEFDLETAFGTEFVSRTKLFQVGSQATSKDEYLLRPDLGRKFRPEARSGILERCPQRARLQIAIGDGLSVTAVSTQVPTLLPLLTDGAAAQGWSIGQTFAIRYCRVGILNEIGELLSPEVVVLLIGERPGLATSESLSAYLAYRPHALHTDADRNLISNIHTRGVSPSSAAGRILNLARQMMAAGTSGFALKEDISGLGE